MSVREVTNLRKSGKLKEAYELAQNELNEDRNEWTTMSMFWVLRDYIQSVYLPKSDFVNAKECLDRMSELLLDMLDDSGMGEKAYAGLVKRLLPNYNIIKEVTEESKTNPIAAYEKIIGIVGKKGNKLNKVLHEDFGWIIYRYMKARTDTLTSVQIRTLLRDYMFLENPRPSVLHSMILTYALNFARQHSDFNFYKFFVMWGIDNLRNDDFLDGYVDGHSIPSLISRICRIIVESGEPIDEKKFVGCFGRHKDEVLEYLLNSFYWKLFNLHKNNENESLWDAFEYYSKHYIQFGPSRSNSEILKLANRFMIDDNSFRFLSFMMNWDISNFLPDDWKTEKDENGNEYSALVVKSAKSCFNIIKNLHNRDERHDLIAWIKGFYAKIIEYDKSDDWSSRNYATICLWEGSKDEAISIYKRLLHNMGEKFYLWSEFAGCFSDDADIPLCIGLLLKSKSVEKNEDFLGAIHLELTDLWLKENYRDIAKQELDVYEKHYIKKGWKLSDEYYSLKNKCDTASSVVLNKPSFVSYIEKAENFVYSEYEWEAYTLVKKTEKDGVEKCLFSKGIIPMLSVKTKRYTILKTSSLGDVFLFRCHKKDGRIIPLMIKKSDEDKWSTIPVKYGVIDNIDRVNTVLHIITQDSIHVAYKYVEGDYEINSFVKMRIYEEKGTEKNYLKVVQLESCSRDEALQNMKSRVVVVDDVNNILKLFHVVLGRGLVNDIVKFDQTSIRPKVGDLLKIKYCVKQNKEGKKRIMFLDIIPIEGDYPELKTTINGKLLVKYKNNVIDNFPDFAFINDNYVHETLLRENGITEDCYVKAEMVLSGNKWKVYRIIKK